MYKKLLVLFPASNITGVCGWLNIYGSLIVEKHSSGVPNHTLAYIRIADAITITGGDKNFECHHLAPLWC